MGLIRLLLQLLLFGAQALAGHSGRDFFSGSGGGQMTKTATTTAKLQPDRGLRRSGEFQAAPSIPLLAREVDWLRRCRRGADDSDEHGERHQIEFE